MMFTKSSIYVIVGITLISGFTGLYLLYSNTNSQLLNATKEVYRLEQTVKDQSEIIQKIKKQSTIIAEESANLANELEILHDENSKLRSELRQKVNNIITSDNPNDDIERDLSTTVNDLFKGIGK